MTGISRWDVDRTITVKAETAQLARVREFVEEVASELSLDLERVFDLKIAVSEACANAVEHAGYGATLLEICACCRSERLTFTVTDSGCFHPPAPRCDQLSSRGLGLPLMVALMDEVTFLRSPGGGTSVSLSVLLDRSTAAPV